MEMDEWIACPVCGDRSRLVRALFRCTLCKNTGKIRSEHFHVWQREMRKRYACQN